MCVCVWHTVRVSRVALHELERYTQAQIGNVHAPETTGKFIAATFEHDTARPVDGYAAPQLHTHAVNLQHYGAAEWADAGIARAESLSVAAVRYDCVSLRACHAVAAVGATRSSEASMGSQR